MIETQNLVPAGSSRIPNWVSGGSYVIGDQVVSPAVLLPYVRRTNGGGVTDPSADATNWQPFAQTIKLIQRGVISVPSGSTTATATITAVDTSKSILSNLGRHIDISRGGSLTLTNSTTITATCTTGSSNTTISYQLVEYY